MKKNILLPFSFLVVMLLVSITNNCHAQTIVNGGFELWPTGCPYNVAPDGWTNYSTNLGPDQAGTCAGTVVSFQGNSHMNLVWYTGTSLAEGASQLITGLVVGQTYHVGFEAINDNGLYSGSDNVILDFSLDGNVIFSTPTLVYNGTWTAYTANFVANATSHTIGFRVNAPSGSTVGSAGVDSVTISTTTNVTDYTNNKFALYPNPTTGQFTLTLPAENAEITVMDMLGQQLIKTQATQKTASLELNNNGVYMVYVTTKQGTTTQKLIVNR